MKKIILLLLTLMLLVGVVSAFSMAASAETAEPQMSIAYCNLSFRDTVCIKYAVASNVSDVKILVWTEPQTDYTVGTHNSEITEYYTENIGGAPHMVFDYTALSAKQMTDVVYARAYAEVDGVDYYSGVNKYSILQYAQNKLATSTDAKLKALLSNMLAYGATAQEYFGYNVDRLPTATWYQIKVTAGQLDDGNTSGLYLPGDKVTLIAPETDAEGKVFSCWVDENENKIATTATYELTVGNANATYTPVYVKRASKGLPFVSNGDGTCYVSGIGTCTDTDIVIPAKSPVGDLVTSIGDEAFYNCLELSSVTIPNSVTSLGKNAFAYCCGLSSVTISDSVTSIGENAFLACFKLAAVTIPDSIENIGDNAFEFCYRLVEIHNCSNLSITVGSSENGGIAYYAKNVYTPTSGQSRLVTKGGYLFCSDDSGNYYLVDYNGADKALVLPADINGNGYEINHYAFHSREDITSATIPDSVTSLGKNAFAYCYGLTSVTIPDSVTSIGNYAFEYCTGLTSVTIGDSVTSIGEWAFNNCSGLTSVTIPNSVTSIGSAAFHSCSGLTSVTIGESVMSIGSNAFNSCSGLTSIIIPNSVTSIDAAAFYACSGLTSVIIPESVTSVGKSAFHSCTGLTSVTIPDSVTNIGNYAFYGCSGLTSVTIPDSVESIGDSAFYKCNGLTSVTIPDSVTSIGSWAFRDCT
ncbi:MAG: leucine-rich repeat domain-containing protein, partial [Clostridia bacterium]|nr:leucine-rich repeat domain-containing protein [Clostridia bacterium]